MSSNDMQKYLFGEESTDGAGQEQQDETDLSGLAGLDSIFGGQALGLDAKDLERGHGERVQAQADALDYEDIDELAEDDEKDFASKPTRIAETKLDFNAAKGGLKRSAEDQDHGFQSAPDKSLSDVGVTAQAGDAAGYIDSKAQLLKTYFPDFKPDKSLHMCKLFAPTPSNIVLHKKKAVRALVPNRISFENEYDQLPYFRSRRALPQRPRRIVRIDHGEFDSGSQQSSALSQMGGKDESGQEDHFLGSCRGHDLSLSSYDWEQNIQWSSAASTPVAKKARFVGPRYESEDFDFDRNIQKHDQKVVLNMNDTNLLLDSRNDRQPTDDTGVRERSVRATSWKFNVSNDSDYEMLRENRQSKSRQNLSQLNVDHATFALRLQMPFYKTRLGKSEARAFHRPQLHFKPNQVVRFSRLQKFSKIRRNMQEHPSAEPLNKAESVALNDTGSFVLTEYSEEHPPLMSNAGMGSRLVNYYRKTDENDERRPKMPFGETQSLNPLDQSPFWHFGNIKSGSTVPALYNKLFRAPVFRHQPQENDFLLIRTNDSHGSRCYLRSIEHLYVVGQTFPVAEVPGPHSRKVTTISKSRLKMITFRLLRKQGNTGLSIKDIAKHFADHTELQIRQRLKEFMDYQKKGSDDQGLWKLKGNELLPDEPGTRALVSPESVCVMNSMQVGVRYLEDSGYTKGLQEDSGEKEDDDTMPIEQKLAPWIITRNFINATQGKGMLELFGDGDPTGCGAGYSFIRTSMKGGTRFYDDELEPGQNEKGKSHNVNMARQQQAYDEIIDRIWNKQMQTLSDTNPPIEAEHTLPSARERRESSEFSARSESSPFPGDHDANALPSKKVLRISRTTKNAAGKTEVKTETIRDPNVIHAYVKRRQEIEDSVMAAESLEPTNDEERNRRVKKNLEAMLAKLSKAKERRQVRKMQKAAGLIGKGARGPDAGDQNADGTPARQGGSSRKCGNCGQVGHMRTSKLCPLYGQLEAGLSDLLEASQ